MQISNETERALKRIPHKYYKINKKFKCIVAIIAIIGYY
jgi:hypothetical protein